MSKNLAVKSKDTTTANPAVALAELIQSAINPEVDAETAAAEKEILSAKKAYDDKMSSYKQLVARHKEAVKASNAVKANLQKVATALKLDVTALGIDLALVPIPGATVSRSSSSSSNRTACPFYVDGAPSPNSRTSDSLSAIAASITGGSGGTASGGRYTTAELTTKLELAGIVPDGTWAYKFRNGHTGFRFNPDSPSLQLSQIEAGKLTDLAAVKDLHAGLAAGK
jgi:hypothetical protein